MINFVLSKVVGRERERKRDREREGGVYSSCLFFILFANMTLSILFIVTVCKTRDSFRPCHGRAHRGVSVTPQGVP